MSKGFRQDLRRQLLAGRAHLPTGRLSRLGKTALAVVRGAKNWGATQELDEQALARWIASIGELKGLAMKMGQILSYVDLALPEQVQQALSVLQTHAQPMSPDELKRVLQAELGEKADQLLNSLEFPPVAAASIGQVHRATLELRGVSRRVAVKVQYPQVEQAIRADFASALIAPLMSQLAYPGARIEPLISEARERFLEECDYRVEARAQAEFGRLFSGHGTLLVPQVFGELSTQRVLTTEYVDGRSFEEFLDSDPELSSRDRLGQALFDFYVGSLFKHGVYNCDPHPGNYLFLDGDRVAMLDYGCTRRFEPDFIQKLARLVLAVHDDDRAVLAQALRGLDIASDSPELFETARALMRAYLGPTLEAGVRPIELGGTISMRQALASKRQLMKLHLPGEFLFLFRIRFGLLSVLARLQARADWADLERRYASSCLRSS